MLEDFDLTIATVVETIREAIARRLDEAQDRFSVIFRCAAHAYHHVGQLIYLSNELAKSLAQSAAR